MEGNQRSLCFKNVIMDCDFTGFMNLYAIVEGPKVLICVNRDVIHRASTDTCSSEPRTLSATRPCLQKLVTL